MNAQERAQLDQFLQQLTQAGVAQKDVEAESLIRSACVRQPDASYLLVQRAMLQDQALQTAQQQIARLQSELSQARASASGSRGGSFLNDSAWGSSASARVPAPAAYASPVAATAAGTPPAPSAWGSGMLGNIATTAAGVVAGSFLFQGISNLMGNHTSNAANTDAMNGLSSNPVGEPQAALDRPADEYASNAGVMDTSSLDDLATDDGGDYV